MIDLDEMAKICYGSGVHLAWVVGILAVYIFNAHEQITHCSLCKNHGD